MSAIRVCRNGVWLWERADDGASPHPSGKGGGPIQPEFGAFVTGVSRYSAKVEKRRGAHSPKVRR